MTDLQLMHTLQQSLDWTLSTERHCEYMQIDNLALQHSSSVHWDVLSRHDLSNLIRQSRMRESPSTTNHALEDSSRAFGLLVIKTWRWSAWHGCSSFRCPNTRDSELSAVNGYTSLATGPCSQMCVSTIAIHLNRSQVHP